MTKTATGISEHDYIQFDNLTSVEKESVVIIKSILSDNGLPPEPLFFRYTENYLAIESRKGLPFSRLKLRKNTWYISLACGDSKSGKKFSRFDISDISSIKDYTNEIIVAFRHCDPERYDRNNVEIIGSELSPDLQRFFGKVTQFSFSKLTSFTPNPSEITFFSSYIEKLKAVGLNWENITIELMSDGALKTRGGRIKFGKKSSYMLYTKPGETLSTKAKNLKLSEYIDFQKYWISECLENRELYRL